MLSTYVHGKCCIKNLNTKKYHGLKITFKMYDIIVYKLLTFKCYHYVIK